MPILQTKDPVILELETICQTKLAMPVTFMEANLSEANFGLDNVEGINFPVLVYVTNKGSNNELNEAHEVQRTVRLFCLLLNKADNPTSDFNSSDMNSLLYQMYQLAQNLQYWINKASISVDGGVDKWKADNVYQQFDSHLFGQALDFEWKVSTGTNGYFNRGY